MLALATLCVLGLATSCAVCAVAELTDVLGGDIAFQVW